VNACTSKCPEAVFVLSGVLPRANQSKTPNLHLEQINLAASRLNELLHQLSESDSKIMFVDNDAAFYDSDKRVCKDFFVTHDVTGVHVNNRGQAILSDNLTVALRKVLIH
jgi:hypothetical protein